MSSLGISDEFTDTSKTEEDDNINLRGITKPNWAKGGIVEYLKFNEEGQAIEPQDTVTRWQRYLGSKATDHRWFSLNVLDWRDFRKGAKLDEAWDSIKVIIVKC